MGNDLSERCGMHPGCLCNLHRHYHPTISWQTRLPDSRQRYLLVDVIEFEFWSDAVLGIIQHAAISQEVSAGRRIFTQGSILDLDRVLHWRCGGYSANLEGAASIRAISRC
jgi:hypothetical protein